MQVAWIVRLPKNHFICSQGVEQQGLNSEHKNEGDENQGERVPGQAEDEFSDEDQMVGLVVLTLSCQNPFFLVT